MSVADVHRFGARAAPPDVAELIASALDLAEMLNDTMLACHIGTALTCAETDAIVIFLARAGYRDAAIGWLASHSEGDEPDDSHGDFWAASPDDPDPPPQDFDPHAYLAPLLTST